MSKFKDICGGEVGLWAHFLALADIFLEEDGILGTVLHMAEQENTQLY